MSFISALPRLGAPLNLDGITMPEGLEEYIINLNQNEPGFDLLVVAGAVLEHGKGSERGHVDRIVGAWWRENVTLAIYEALPRWMLASCSVAIRGLEELEDDESVPGRLLDQVEGARLVAMLVLAMEAPEGSDVDVEERVLGHMDAAKECGRETLMARDWEVDYRSAVVLPALMKERRENPSPLPDERYVPLWWEEEYLD